MNLDIKETKDRQTFQLQLTGEIDAYTAPKLREVLIPLAEEQGNAVIVDLSNVNYIDSTGLGIFIGALKASHHYKSEIKLTGVTSRIRRLFTITGLDEVLDIENNETEEAK